MITSLVETCGWANINAIVTNGATPLHYATQNWRVSNALDVIRYLVQQCGADIHAVTISNGDTPLHIACWSAAGKYSYSSNKLGVIHYLVEQCGADIPAVNASGDTPLHLACYRGWKEAVVYLVGLLPDVVPTFMP
jgi:ankyrin repeat protein